MTTAGQIETVSQLRVAVADRDWQAASTFMHNHVNVVVPDELPYGGTWSGQLAMQHLHLVLGRTWGEWREGDYASTLASADNRVYRETAVRARSLRTGRFVGITYAEVFTFDGEKVSQVYCYYSDATLVAAVCKP